MACAVTTDFVQVRSVLSLLLADGLVQGSTREQANKWAECVTTMMQNKNYRYIRGGWQR